jgi:hypothetical protein
MQCLAEMQRQMVYVYCLLASLQYQTLFLGVENFHLHPAELGVRGWSTWTWGQTRPEREANHTFWKQTQTEETFF